MLQKSREGTEIVNPEDNYVEDKKEDGILKKDSVLNEEQKSYQGECFEFYKVNSEMLPKGTSNILNIYGVEYIESLGAYACMYDNTYQSLFIGQCLTLFGSSEYVSENNKDLFSYVVGAKDSKGNVIYLEVYYGASGPAVGGIARDETYNKAAKDLAKIIMDAKASDFEKVSEYKDVGVTIKMGVKDGKAYYDTIFPEGEDW